MEEAPDLRHRRKRAFQHLVSVRCVLFVMHSDFISKSEHLVGEKRV